jgi:hypothetical protein
LLHVSEPVKNNPEKSVDLFSSLLVYTKDQIPRIRKSEIIYFLELCANAEERGIFKRIIQDTISIINIIDKNYANLEGSNSQSWRIRMRMRLEGLTKIAISFGLCQPLAILSFYLHSIPKKSKENFVDILNLTDYCKTGLRLESVKYSNLLLSWALPIQRKIFLKGFASSKMMKNIEKEKEKIAERNSQEAEKIQKVEKIFGDKIPHQLRQRIEPTSQSSFQRDFVDEISEDVEFEWMRENNEQCVICRRFRGTKLRIWCPSCYHSYHPNCHRSWFKSEIECANEHCTCNCLDIT